MNPEHVETLVASRMVQAQDCLSNAKEMLNGSITGRSIVNRCFYAGFYAVLALLQLKGKAPRRHSGAIKLFDLGGRS